MDEGVCVISFSLSLYEESYFKNSWTTGIPPLVERLFNACLPTILHKLNVDRTSSYFERFYSQADICRRIVAPSKCVKEDYLTLRSGPLTKLLHQRIIPTGVVVVIEYVIARFMTTSKGTRYADAVILKLAKGKPTAHNGIM
jgi:hypothetical protein